MTNEELKAAIELFSYIEEIAKEMQNNPYAKSHYNVLLAARELLQLKNGTHPDMVMVKMGELDLRYEQGRRDELNKLALAATQKGNAK